jgi:hypothetical protein
VNVNLESVPCVRRRSWAGYIINMFEFDLSDRDRLGVTADPNAEWLARQLTEACGWDEPPRYLIYDRDGAYGDAFVRRLRAMGIRDRPVSGYAERLIGSIRRECLDHVVIIAEVSRGEAVTPCRTKPYWGERAPRRLTALALQIVQPEERRPEPAQRDMAATTIPTARLHGRAPDIVPCPLAS